MEQWQVGGFGLYVHWPFCQSKCPYCDFNSHVASTIDQAAWKSAYLTELDRMARETPGRVLSSIFFGGGTPSLMPPDTVAEIIQKACKIWTPANDIEITLEANPTSVEAGKFGGFRDAGVNRVSIGVQALNDADLRKLGRMHNAHEAIKAIEIAQSIFARSSFDLIYARQDQSLSEWQSELTTALSLSAEHLSLYQLTVEPGTVFADRARLGKLRGLPSEDLAADMYELTQDVCEKAGKPAYEVSNHAFPGAESRHNLIYWRCGDYVGIGPGAHGRITDAHHRRSATTAYLSPATWLAQVQTTGNGDAAREILTHDERADEFLLMGLRINEGVKLNDLELLRKAPLDPSVLESLQELNLIDTQDQTLRATMAGRMVLNQIIRSLAA